MKQLSVFVENRPGRVADVIEILAANKINIRALSIADTEEFGVMRLVVDRPTLAQEKIAESGVIVRVNQVLSLPIPDVPGGLSHVLNLLRDGNVSIEYLYAFCMKEQDNALVVLRADDPSHAKAVLAADGILPFEIEQE